MNANLSRREILKMALKLFLIGSVSIILGIGSYRIIINEFPTFSLLVSGEKDWYLLEGFASVISLALLLVV